MFFIELFVPRGALSPRRREQVAERLATAVVTEDDAAAESVEAVHAVTDVVVHEPTTWVAGRQRHGPDLPPRYVVRVSVPGPWRKEMSEHIVTRITRVLADLDDDPDRLYREPHASVHVMGVSEGSYGLYGRVVGSSELGEMLSTPYREARRAGTAAEPRPDSLVDPSCGAVIPLAEKEQFVVTEIDGVTQAFCCAGCRDAYLAEAQP